jgi:hypothetical protein
MKHSNRKTYLIAGAWSGMVSTCEFPFELFSNSHFALNFLNLVGLSISNKIHAIITPKTKKQKNNLSGLFSVRNLGNFH